VLLSSVSQAVKRDGRVKITYLGKCVGTTLWRAHVHAFFAQNFQAQSIHANLDALEGLLDESVLLAIRGELSLYRGKISLCFRQRTTGCSVLIVQHRLQDAFGFRLDGQFRS
jgi:hypothetical protein